MKITNLMCLSLKSKSSDYDRKLLSDDGVRFSKWKGKICIFDPTAGGTGISNSIRINSTFVD